MRAFYVQNERYPVINKPLLTIHVRRYKDLDMKERRF